MPAVSLVAVGRLHEDGGLRETLGEDLSPDVVEPNPLADVAAGLLHHAGAVHVGQKTQAKSIEKSISRDRKTLNI